MIIDCISDLHGSYPELSGGDLLIVAGDFTAMDRPSEYNEFAIWLKDQKYIKKIVVPGNHDAWLQESPDAVKTLMETAGCDYLCDSGIKVCYYRPLKVDAPDKTEISRIDLNIWGTPWTPWFEGVNPKCKAFMRSESAIGKKFNLIPEDTDILVSHGPPNSCLDSVHDMWDGSVRNCGSHSLREAVDRVKPKYHVFGHIHEHGGKRLRYKWMMEGARPDCQMMNVSHVDENYKPKNGATRIEL